MNQAIPRRLLLGASLASLAAPALAQGAWPARPIRFISPWPPGGPADLIARPIIEKVSQALGQPVVLETRPGAGGTLAVASVARAAPDGYTVLFSQAGPNAITPAFRAVPYDPIRDFIPVTQLVSSGLVFVIRPGIAANSVAELVNVARSSNPGLNFGSIGPASTTHLAGEMFMRAAGINLLHVPYTGSTQPITDMLAGRIDMGFWNIGAVMGFIQSGQLRPLAVTTLGRSSRLPDVPAMAETYPGFEMNSWYGVHMPAGTPAPIIDRLHTEFVAALRAPDVSARLVEAGLEIEGTSPAQFAQKIAAALLRMQELQRATGLRAE
ncbi:Bug family tripartite tricarboxylate transporter substrate binding protein [Falsiroseomonas ponticola]|uniref:Bug family tripartite tricarboxylate transporter substrate binding protein n=1 Tax=Falsiroseomonas ponticola TaxID=2786951 RepID=UPI001931A226|nr:tripartite tricarboxylate transporter substrate binding protein [Roseomonas ponticola]